MADVPEGWEMRGHPPVLFRRFGFARYGEIRTFLDAVAALSAETGMHPQNINFGTTYVNITLEGNDGAAPGNAEFSLASRINDLHKVEGS